MKMSFSNQVNRLDWTLMTGLVLLCLLAYAQVATHGLSGFDDRDFLDYKTVVGGLTIDNALWALTTTHMAIWHPLTWWTYQIETSLFGAENASVRHIVNLVLHIVTTLICYLVTFRLFMQMIIGEQGRSSKMVSFAAFSVSFLFAFHPQHVQVIAWLSERKELLAALFSMLAFYAHMRSKLVFALLFFVIALMSKASALPVAFVMIIYDATFQWSVFFTVLKRRFFYYGALVGFALASIIATLITQTRLKVDSPEITHFVGDGINFTQWFGYIVLNLGHYLKNLFVPWTLPIFVERPEVITSDAIIQSLIWIALAICFVIAFRKNRWVLFGSAWFLLFWLPTSGVVNIGDIYVADRYMYQAHIGAFIALVAAMLSIYQRCQSFDVKVVKIATLALIFPIFGAAFYLSYLQTSYWQDTIKFYERELVINSKSLRPYVILGREHQRRDNIDDAYFYYNQLLDRKPDDFYGNLYSGYLNTEQGQHSIAKDQFIIATQQAKPGKHHFIDKAYEGLAWNYFKLGQLSLANSVAKQGLEKFPNNQYFSDFIETQSRDKNRGQTTVKD